MKSLQQHLTEALVAEAHKRFKEFKTIDDCVNAIGSIFKDWKNGKYKKELADVNFDAKLFMDSLISGAKAYDAPNPEKAAIAYMNDVVNGDDQWVEVFIDGGEDNNYDEVAIADIIAPQFEDEYYKNL